MAGAHIDSPSLRHRPGELAMRYAVEAHAAEPLQRRLSDDRIFPGTAARVARSGRLSLAEVPSHRERFIGACRPRHDEAALVAVGLSSGGIARSRIDRTAYEACAKRNGQSNESENGAQKDLQAVVSLRQPNAWLRSLS